MLAAGSVQEAHDFALVAHAATLRSRVPFLHFFDGFRTSHEIDKIAMLDDDDLARADPRRRRRSRIRARGLTPDAPVVRGTAQNPDVFFQAREAANPFHLAVPGIVAGGHSTSWRPGPAGATASSTTTARRDAERVIVVMGSAAGAVEETVDDARRRRASGSAWCGSGCSSPFPVDAARRRAARRRCARSPCSTAPRSRARSASRSTSTVLAALDRGAWTSTTPPFARAPRVIGGRYGLSSKEVTPSMVKPVFDELARRPAEATLHGRHLRRRHRPEPAHRPRLPLPAPGRRGAGHVLRARLRRHRGRQQELGEDHRREHRPVRPGLLRLRLQEVGLGHGLAPAVRARADPLDLPDRRRRLRGLPPVRPAREDEGPRRTPGRARRSCSTRPFGADEVWDRLPRRGAAADHRQAASTFWVIDAVRRRREVGMGNRINTVMQPCFFQLSGVLPADEAIAQHQGSRSRRPTPGGAEPSSSATSPPSTAPLAQPASGRRPRRGDEPAVDRRRPSPTTRRTSCKRVTALLMAGDGDLLPVSALPGRRHVPDRDGEVREAGDRQGDPDLGPRRLHRLRQVRHRLPARHDPDEGLRRRGGRRRARRSFLSKAVPLEGPRRPPPHDPGRARRLHRLRRLRRRLPGQEQDRDRATRRSTWSRCSTTATSSAAAGSYFLVDPAARPRPAAPRLGEGLPGARAAVRVLRRLRRLRRDARTSSSSPSCSATA